MSDEIWFWVEKGERRGPSTAAKVLRLLDEGALSETTLVWCDGMPEWLPFHETDLADEKINPPAPAVAGSRAPVTAPKKELIPVRDAELNPDYRPQFRSILGRGWSLMTSDFWPFVGLCLLTSILLSIAMQFWIPIAFLMYPITTGYAFYVLLRMRGKQASIDELFIGFKKPFKDLALLNLVLSIPMALMLILFIAGITVLIVLSQNEPPEAVQVAFVVGFGIWFVLTIIFSLIVQIVANFACLLIVDCGCDWRRALSLGWEVTRRYLVKHVVVFLLLGVLSFAGIFALYFGVFITSTWAWIAMIFLYEDAFGESADTGDDGV